MEVTLKKNIKYNKMLFSVGETIRIDKDDLSSFLKAGAVEGGEEMKAKVKIKREVEETEVIESPTDTPKETSNSKAYEDMTKAELSELLTTKGIEFTTKETKNELLELLLGSE